mgnify:CR=1 FL=1|jgi:GR25 family glycosyltransferase involved in LPS biosynthesis
MLEQLKPYGIEPTIISGADRQDMYHPPVDYRGDMAQEHLGRQMGLGEIGCLIGHLRAFQQIINSGDEYGHIMEDDCQLNADPMPLFRKVIDENPDARLILGHTAMSWNCQNRRIYRDRGDYLELTGLPYGAWNYVIHRKLAGQAIMHLRQCLHIPGDVYMQKWAEQNVQTGTYFQIEGLSQERPTDTSVIGDETRMANSPPSHWRQLESNDTCPLLIHQIWLGPDAPDKEMATWAKVNPGRIYKRWGVDECYNICREYGVGDVFGQYFQPKHYPGAADIARYCILHKFGGFYADADSVAQRPLELRYPFFVQESEKYKSGILCNGFIQTHAGDPYMLDMIRRIATLNHPVPWYNIHQALGPSLLTSLKDVYPRQHLPSGLFLPDHFMGPNEPAGDPYCTHSWDTTMATNPEFRRNVS